MTGSRDPFEGRGTPTAPEKLVYFVMGDKGVEGQYRQEHWPSYPTGVGHPMPITVVCNTPFHVKNMQHLQPWLRTLAAFDDPRRIIKALRTITTNSRQHTVARVLTATSSFYPILQGVDGREAIFTNWPDVKPYFRSWSMSPTKRCGTLLEALEWLLMRGGEYYSEEDEAARLKECEQLLEDVKLEANATHHERDGRGSRARVQADVAAPSFTLHADIAIADSEPESQATPSRASDAEENAEGGSTGSEELPHPDFPDARATTAIDEIRGSRNVAASAPRPSTPPQARSPSPPSRPSRAVRPTPSTPRRQRTTGAPAVEVIDISSGEESIPPPAPKTPIRKAASQHSGSSRGVRGSQTPLRQSSRPTAAAEPNPTPTRKIRYLNYRDMSGQVVGCSYSLVYALGVEVPHFTPFLDDFLDRFGWTTSFILALHDVTIKRPSYADFVMQLCEIGLARSEAEWFHAQLPDRDPAQYTMRKRTIVVPV